MGDGNHDGVSYSNSIRSLLENKLSNRSLVLVGGGVVQSTALVGKRTGNGMGGGGTTTMMMQQQQQLQHASSTTAVAWTSSSSGISSKRVRKRVGGNGIFGCISNKRRKKIMNKSILTPRGKKKDEYSDHHDELNIRDGNIQQKLPIIPTQSSPEQQTTTQQASAAQVLVVQPSSHEVVQRQSSKDEIIADTGGNNMEREVQEKVGSVIETLHAMWLNYIRALCQSSSLIPSSSKSSTTTTLHTTNVNTAARTDTKTTNIHTSLLSLDQRKQLSYLLATSEHVGMAVTIAQCPSRRHLVRQRSVVIQETNETWTMALLVPKKRKKQKKKSMKHAGVSKPNEVVESIDTIAVVVEVVPPTPPPSSSEQDSTNTAWKIVMVPKRGTVLDVTLPWWGDDTPKQYVNILLAITGC